MTIYREIVWSNRSKPTLLDPRDILKYTTGGIELTFNSSKSLTTFLPYHRIESIQTTDTEKLPKAVNDDGSIDDDSIML